MTRTPAQTGFEPRTRDPERRAFYDLLRRVVALEAGGGGGGSGSEEVFIGPSDPGTPYELWYDTDADTPQVGKLQIDADPLVYPATIGTSPVTLATLDMGVETYRRIVLVYVQSLVTIDSAAAYGNLRAALSGQTTRSMRVRQSNTPSSLNVWCVGNIAPGAACVAEAQFTCQATAAVTMAGTTDYNRIDVITLGVW